MKYYKFFMVGLGVICSIIFGDFSVAQRATAKVVQDIYYDNIEYSDNVSFYGVDGLTIQYTGELIAPGDSYEISFDVVNDADSDVIISQCRYQKDDKFVEYHLTYENGNLVQVGDVLKKGEKKRIKYLVFYKDLIDRDSYEFDSSFYISYEHAL